MPTSPEDQALIDLWRQGDQDAARQIVNCYIGRLVQLARRHISQRLASRVDPEDIVQSVFRTFFGRLREGQFVFNDQDDLCKLLVRITLHKTLRQVAFHRAAKRNPSQETEQGDHRERLLAVLDQEPSPEASIAFLDQLEHLLARLRPAERQILELRLQGYSNEEIAAQLGIYDRKIRRAIERVRSIARREGLTESGEPAV
jgi:RNA polymerase sigma-70 factor (ECF subfamily)